MNSKEVHFMTKKGVKNELGHKKVFGRAKEDIKKFFFDEQDSECLFGLRQPKGDPPRVQGIHFWGSILKSKKYLALRTEKRNPFQGTHSA